MCPQQAPLILCFSKLTSSLSWEISVVCPCAPFLVWRISYRHYWDSPDVLLGQIQRLWPSRGPRAPMVLPRPLDCHIPRIRSSSHPTHLQSLRGCILTIFLAFLGPHLPNGPLSSDLLGFGWDNAFSDVIPFKKVSQEINERGTLIFCHAKHRGTCFKTPRQDEKHDWKLDQPCFKLDSLLHLILWEQYFSEHRCY